MPNGFQRPLAMLAKPPLAASRLRQERKHAHQQAYRVSAIRREVEADGEIEDGSDDGLGDVVR